MKKFFTLTLALLASFSLWAATTTLFSTDFTESGWNSLNNTSTSQTLTIGTQTVYVRANNTGNLPSVNTTSGELTWGNRNFSNKDCYIAIPVSGVNGSITVSVANGETNTRVTYATSTSETVSNPSSTTNSSSAAPTTFTVEGIKGNFLMVYLGRQGSGLTKATSITITTPVPDVTHALAWDFDGGNCSATAGTDYTAAGQVAEGATITYPANNTMTKDGYDFNGWSTSVTTMPTSDLTITAQWVEHTTSNDATLSAFSIDGYSFNETFNPENTDYTVTLPFYASAPAVSAVHATKNNAYASVGDVTYDGTKKEYSVTVTAENTVYTKTYTITLNWAATPTASSSINIEQLVLDNSKSYDIGSALDAANIAYVDKDALDSLLMGTNDKAKDDCNEAYLGLKFKKATSKFTIIVPSGEALNVKFGATNNLTVSVNGAAAAAPSLTNGVYSLAASEGAKEVVFALTGTQTVVLKQIMVGEDIAVVRPFKITKNPTENGTFSVDLEKYAKSEEVTVNCVPETGYQLSTITVIGYTSKGAEQEVEVTGNKFTMPGSPVNITVTFSVATALDNTEASVKAVKVLKNGVLFIEKNGKKYNIIGAELR